MNDDSNRALTRILADYRRAAASNRDLGTRFERLIRRYLLADPQYDFDKVWLWSEWPDHQGADAGIDLVARENGTGDYWAIQCKFYEPDHYLPQGEVDSFFTASGRSFMADGHRAHFAKRLFVTTTDKLSANTERAFADQGIPVSKLTLDDLYASPVDWSQVDEAKNTPLTLVKPRTPKLHQQDAITAVTTGLRDGGRGKLIMACGTGKTYVSLRIAEALVPKAGMVLFLAPSIHLVGQALREWSAHAEARFHAFVVCSDSKAGKDEEDIPVHDLAYPATTDARKLANAVAAVGKNRRKVIFATYQSISVVCKAQQLGGDGFDLIVCDEAHRTTGIDAGKDTSEFVKVHEQKFIRAARRLYMTATPRIFGEPSKTKANRAGVVLYSMDDETKYGPELYRINFGKAADLGLLSEYKVLIVAVDEAKMAALANNANTRFQLEGKSAIDADFAVKIIGAWKGLSKRGLYVVDGEGEPEQLSEDTEPMHRAVAFSHSIKASKTITDTFSKITSLYDDARGHGMLTCELDHVDGTMNAQVRRKAIKWLEGKTGEDECRILSNARCLSEGVDVPALDGVVFFDTRDSMVDIVQSVGRVMRKADGKHYGYVILPVAIPWGKINEYDQYVSSDPRFKAIWKVLKALRAHDERLVDESVFRSHVRVVADPGGGEPHEQPDLPIQYPDLPVGDLTEAVFTAIPLKLGDREYWSSWAKDVAKRAETIKERIVALLKADAAAAKAFDVFLKGLQDTLNPGVSRGEAIEMLVQHILTLPVFQALFGANEFPANNIVGKGLESMVATMERAKISSETLDLEKFYQSVRERVALARSDKSRQDIIRSLYNAFFHEAFPELAKRLGVVYTPVPIVDFILRSAEAVLTAQFGRSLANANVHIIDPFTGTGTFLARLIQSGILDKRSLHRKYGCELHANEIVLLAYYIASVNIETAHHAATGDHVAFDGIVLTDTFQASEPNDLVDEVVFPQNNARIQRQLRTPITVVVGNPPYDMLGSRQKYEHLDHRIEDTYAKASRAKKKNNLYDPYVRAFRWASDRISGDGVVAFVTNGGWLEGNAMAGFRKCLQDEFADLYIFNLRGNQRTKGELSRREGGKVFDRGSRAPVAISVLIKRRDHHGAGRIRYFDVGDYKTAKEKLTALDDAVSVDGVDWTDIQPNQHNDWINQRSEDYQSLLPLTGDGGVFADYQQGAMSSRDAWVYSFRKGSLAKQVQATVTVYNEEVERLRPILAKVKGKQTEKAAKAKALVTDDKTKIKWTDSLISNLVRGTSTKFDPDHIVSAMYRPYTREWFYYDPIFNHRYKARLWPTAASENVVIQVPGTGATIAPSCFAVHGIVDLECISKGQCLPLYHYVKVKSGSGSGASTGEMFSNRTAAGGYERHDGVTDDALATFRKHYDDAKITKLDVFHYVYGVLHAPDFRRKYANDLKLEMPRIPLAPDFHAFASAGKKLMDLHLGYEAAEPYPLTETAGRLVMEDADYQVRKMRFGRTKDGKPDRTTIIYNDNLTLGGIPLDAYRYKVNGSSAIEWIMDQYRLTVDNKGSGIRSDPNGAFKSPREIVTLLERVVTVSIETMKIVDKLPVSE